MFQREKKEQSTPDSMGTVPGWLRAMTGVRVPSRWDSLPQATRQQTTVLGFKAAYGGTIIVRHTGQP